MFRYYEETFLEVPKLICLKILNDIGKSCILSKKYPKKYNFFLKFLQQKLAKKDNFNWSRETISKIAIK